MIKVWEVVGLAAHAKTKMAEAERMKFSANWLFWSEQYDKYRDYYTQSLVLEIETDLVTLSKLNKRMLEASQVHEHQI